MWKYLGLLNRNLIIAIPVMMVLGFVFGVTFSAGCLKNLIIPFTFLMVYPMMVTLKIRKVFEGGDIKAQVITQIINFGVIPFLAFGLGLYFFRDQPYMALGLLLAGLVPTSGMTISWTGFARGNVEAAVKMTVIGLVIGSLATPFYVKFLMGAELEVNIMAVMKQIVLIVFLPMLAGYLTRQYLMKRFGQKEFRTRWAPRFPGLSIIGVLGIVFIAIALKAPAIAGSPQMPVKIFFPLVIIYTFNYLLSTVTGRAFLPRGDAIALVYGSVMRNLSIALAIAINAFGPEGSSTALVIAVAYIIQVQSAAWYVKFTDLLYGSESAETESGKKSVEKKTDAAATAAGVPRPQNPVPAFRRILFATDLSETARHAVRYACSIAHQYDAEVTVLHVVPDIVEEFSAGAGIDLVEHVGEKEWKRFNEKGIAAARKKIQERIEENSRRIIREIPRCPVQDGDVRVEVGSPVQKIVSIAENGGYDLVVMGTHGHGKLEDFMIGSISSGVIRKSSVPVLVARLPEHGVKASAAGTSEPMAKTVSH